MQHDYQTLCSLAMLVQLRAIPRLFISPNRRLFGCIMGELRKNNKTIVPRVFIYEYKVPLREVPNGVAQE